MASRHVFNTMFMEACIEFAKRCNFQWCPQLEELCCAVFEGILSSKPCEDSNKFVRQHELQDNCAKVMAHFTLWDIPTKHDVLKSRERIEIEPVTAISLPREPAGNYRHFFQKAHVAEEKETFPMKEVLQESTWWSPNAQSLKAWFADHALLDYCHDKKNWSLADPYYIICSAGYPPTFLESPVGAFRN